jgi:hypothetical protein
VRLFPLLLASLALFTTGCESVQDRFNSRVAEVPAQTHDYDGSVEQVYLAGQKAFKRLDFVLTRSSMGRIEAASSIHESMAFGDSRQLVANVEIHEVGPGKVEVGMRLTQDVSSESVGGTHRTVLRDHSFYALYFATLQQVLADQMAAKPTQKD